MEIHTTVLSNLVKLSLVKLFDLAPSDFLPGNNLAQYVI